MNRNQVISIRLTTDEKQRLAQASALAGFDSLGTYIRTRLFQQDDQHASDEGDMAVDALMPILFGLQREQSKQSGILAVLLSLLAHKTTQGDLHTLETELIRAQELGLSPMRLCALLNPQLSRLLNALEEG